MIDPSLFQTVDHHEVGKVLAVLASVQALIPFAAAPLYGFLYKQTVEKFPAACILVAVGLYLIEGEISFSWHSDLAKLELTEVFISHISWRAHAPCQFNVICKHASSVHGAAYAYLTIVNVLLRCNFCRCLRGCANIDPNERWKM